MEKSLAPALTKGLEILELVATKESLSFGQIQKLTDYNVSSLNRYLKVLVASGYLTKTNDQKYIVGMKPILIAKSKNLWKTIIHQSQDILSEISENFGVTALVIGYGEDTFTALNKVAHKDNITMMSIGTTFEKATTVIPWGIPCLAELSDIDLKKAMNNIPEESWDIIDIKIKELKENGYMAYYSKTKGDIVRIAVPINDGQGRLIGVLAAGSATSQIQETDLYRLIEELQSKAGKILGQYL